MCLDQNSGSFLSSVQVTSFYSSLFGPIFFFFHNLLATWEEMLFSLGVGDDFQEQAAKMCGKDHQLSMVVVERGTSLNKV